jgi:hypothetical protein
MSVDLKYQDRFFMEAKSTLFELPELNRTAIEIGKSAI